MLCISLEDDFETIKEKIQKTDNSSSAYSVLKKKISTAKTKEDIINSFVFMLAYSNGNPKQL